MILVLGKGNPRWRSIAISLVVRHGRGVEKEKERRHGMKGMIGIGGIGIGRETDMPRVTERKFGTKER